jgi:hypothetical protein
VSPVAIAIIAFLFVAGSLLLTFTYSTVYHGGASELAKAPGTIRMSFSIRHWCESGYFRSGGLLVRPQAGAPGYHHYVSSTGGHMVSAFILQKLYHAATGRYSLRLIALHNTVVALLAASMLGLLAFRLVRRSGMAVLHALVLASCILAVLFTFPDNLALYWEIGGRVWFSLFAALFLLLEERAIDHRTPVTTILQGLAAFLLTYMEFGAGVAFITSYVVASVALGSPNRIYLKRLAVVAVGPVLVALTLFGAQRSYLAARHPDAPIAGSTFLFRTGFDGSSQYYVDHLDIAYRRDTARANFRYNREHLFRWPWLFFAGTAAFVSVLCFAMRGVVPEISIVSLLSLLGSYLLYGAVFSQAFVIHPYLFDVLLVTPLVLALFAVAPALFESMSRPAHRGVVVVVIFFAAVWLTMAQIRQYALQYPSSSPGIAEGAP